ncbi:MAG: type II toxin-antitoxin system RelE/ParE family toxin [Vicingaceae bacterium]
MIVKFDKGFAKSLKREINPLLKKGVAEFIRKADKATDIHELPSVKKMKGYTDFYRYRIGKYRIGFRKIDNHTISLIIVAKRSTIYRRFP